MVLSYKTLSNKLLHSFFLRKNWSKEAVNLRQISSTVQPKNSNTLTQRKLTLSEYLKNILINTEHRSGYAQVLNSKINNLKSNTLSSSSTEGFKNILLNNKIKNISQNANNFNQTSDDFATLNNAQSVKKYSNLVLSQLTELSYFTQYSGLRNFKNVSVLSKKDNNTVEHNIRHYLNLLTKFEYKLSNSYYDYFHFNKSNNNKYLFAMEKATNLLKLVFLSKGCLISKPIFNVVYSSNQIEGEVTNINYITLSNDKPKVIINLFYFVNFAFSNTKSLGLQSKRRNMYEAKLNSNLQAILNEVGNFKDGQITTIYNDKFLFLGEYLNKLFNCDVELNLVRLYLPYQDSNILAQYLNIGSFKKRFVYLASRLFRKVKIFKKTMIANRGIKTTLPNGNSLPACILNGPFAPLGENAEDTANSLWGSDKVAYPSGISGVNIKLAGRTPTQKLIPRVAVRRAQRGNFSRLNSKMIEKSMCIDTSKKGSFNFTVRLSHVFR